MATSEGKVKGTVDVSGVAGAGGVWFALSLKSGYMRIGRGTVRTIVPGTDNDYDTWSLVHLHQDAGAVYAV